MAITLYDNQYDVDNSIHDFLNMLYRSEMNHFASDLLQVGFSPSDIQEAINRAVSVGITADMEIPKHFSPFYSQIDGQIINDCKLSRMAYALVLLNARPNIKVTSNWQIKVLDNIFKDLGNH